MMLTQNSQCAKILARLRQRKPGFVLMPTLARISGSYNVHSRIDELRKRHGHDIENRTDVSVRPHISKYRLVKLNEQN